MISLFHIDDKIEHAGCDAKAKKSRKLVTEREWLFKVDEAEKPQKEHDAACHDHEPLGISQWAISSQAR